MWGDLVHNINIGVGVGLDRRERCPGGISCHFCNERLWHISGPVEVRTRQGERVLLRGRGRQRLRLERVEGLAVRSLFQLKLRGVGH